MARFPKRSKVEIVVRGNDHNPPHFHVVGPDVAAQVEIETLKVLRGSLPKKALWVLEWAAENRPALYAEWNRRNPHLKVE